MNTFCEISSRNQLADYLEVPASKLTYILYVKKTEKCYKTFSIPKKSGGERIIHSPSEELKDIQRKLARALCEHQQYIWKEQGIHPCISHAFERKKSIISNASVHRNKRFVLNLDLENFFDCFHFGRVQGFFEKNRNFKVPHEVAVTIAQIACFNGRLPQGAPSSPIITNLICQILDFRILKIAKKHHLDYTRYADDLTFSTNDKKFLEDYEIFRAEIVKEIERAGFSINEKKTRLQYKDSQQKVTGLVVNKQLNVDRQYYKTTRAMAYRLYTTGEFMLNGNTGAMKQLEGRFTFIDQLCKHNNKLDKNRIHDFRHLSGREKQYQMFLFYKYFYARSSPLIITEGKTDIVYLRAALKNLYREYPKLITKKKDGSFEFHVSFLKRSKRLKHFFGFYQDGADTMKNLYNYFSPKGGGTYFNYLKYFYESCPTKPVKPIIFLFDNELSNKDKPLANFAHHVSLSDAQKKELSQKLYTLLIEQGKVYLATNELVSEKTECEIEDLFSNEILSHKIEGREFTRKGSYDTKKYYGKEIFSKYVADNYKSINFDGFKKTLDALNTIIIS